jgi:hypothetical protein
MVAKKWKPLHIGIVFFLGELFGILFSLSAETVSSKVFQVPNPRLAALGGLHTTFAEDMTTLWNNPAGLYSVKSQFRLSELTLSLGGPVFSLANIIFRAAGDEDIDTLLTDPAVLKVLKNIYTTTDLAGPISFGYVGHGLGFAIVNNSSVEVKGVGSTSFDFQVSERLLLYGGYAFRLYGSPAYPIDIGINLKTFLQGTTQFVRTLLEIPDLTDEGMDLLVNSPYSLTTGIGIDAGVLFPLGQNWKMGIVARDLFTPTTRSDYTSFDAFLSEEDPAPAVKGTVPMDLSIGVQYTPPLGFLEFYIRGLKLMLDYRDSLDFLTHPDTAVNPLLKVGFGIELQVLEVLWLRAGMTEGLLSAGFGLDYGLVRVHFAMFGSEQSIEPGLRSVFNIALGIEIIL